MRSKSLVIIIIACAFILRILDIDWDSGFHFHPDERMLIMVSERITFFSNLNPHFFNYGSLPVYLLKGTSQLLDYLFGTHVATYDGMLWVGRMLSTITDLLVIALIYRISMHLFKDKTISLWSCFFYAIAFFPIQNSHFFIVDTFLNLFSTLLVYLLLEYREKPSIKKVIMIGIVFAAALTCKVSAVIFLPIILFSIITPLLTKEGWISRLVGRDGVVFSLFLFGIVTLTFAFIFMPYAFIEYTQFISDVSAQVRMNSDPYVFPYTLQYVGTLPYLYYLKNIFFWGLGPVISILAIVGLIGLIQKILPSIPSLPRRGTKGVVSFGIFFLFYLIYFIVIGKSSVKFMRYLLLMYPFFAIMAGVGTSVILNLIQDLSHHNWFSLRKRFRNKFGMTEIFIITATLLWTSMFLNIYTTPNTRIQATNWINQFIPHGSTLAVEHWDDRVPIFDPGVYNYEELTLYDIPDDGRKWQLLNEKLDRSDFIIIASNRLYTPLQYLDVCEPDTYPRCYPLTSDYYKKLFAHEGEFVKIAQFTSYPRLNLGGWKFELNDTSADESFTVYDHPTIMIFARK
ncbi:MAG: glycosyltransferase family 39 protein [bacterium]|nr:glycosyltransferase family 39 protein [bacterium]